MVGVKLEGKINKVFVCLDFVSGVLVKTNVGLDPKEIEGLAYILTDILEQFQEVRSLILTSKEVP